MCDQQAAQASDQGEQQALDEQLPHDRAASGAQRNPNRNLARPGGGPGHQHAGDVETGDEQEHADDREQQEQRRANIAADHLAKRHDGDRDILVGRVDLQPARHGVHLGSHGRQGDGRLHAADNLDVPPLGLSPRPISIERERHPIVDVAHHQMEFGRHDAGDSMRDAIQLQRLPDDRRILAEPLAPETMAHDRHGSGARPIVLLRERVAEERFHTHHTKQLG